MQLPFISAGRTAPGSPDIATQFVTGTSHQFPFSPESILHIGVVHRDDGQIATELPEFTQSARHTTIFGNFPWKYRFRPTAAPTTPG